MTDARVMPDARTLEQALRDAGLSRRQAKALLSGGLTAVGLEQRDDVQVAGDDDAALVAELKRAAETLRGTHANRS